MLSQEHSLVEERILSVKKSSLFADAPIIEEARNATFNVGGDEPMSVADLAGRISEVMGVPLRIDLLPPRKEVMHAHCRHDAAARVFQDAYAAAVPIVPGLKLMADDVRARVMPAPTECPSPIEIDALLPASWRERTAPGRKL